MLNSTTGSHPKQYSQYHLLDQSDTDTLFLYYSYYINIFLFITIIIVFKLLLLLKKTPKNIITYGLQIHAEVDKRKLVNFGLAPESGYLGMHRIWDGQF